MSSFTGSPGTYQWFRGNKNISGATSSYCEAKKSGNYSCTLTNACGTATSNIISATINDQPEAAIVPAGIVSMCEGEATLLTANSGSNLSYQWMKGSSEITGATNQAYSTSKKGNYKVLTINNLTGCSNLSKKTTVEITCKQAGNLSSVDQLNVFPNPSSENFFVQAMINGNSETTGRLVVKDIIGNIWIDQMIDVQEGIIEATIKLPSHASPGIYLLIFSLDNTIYKETIVLQ